MSADPVAQPTSPPPGHIPVLSVRARATSPRDGDGRAESLGESTLDTACLDSSPPIARSGGSAASSPDLHPDDRISAAHHLGPGPLLRLVRRQELAFAAVGVVNTVMGIGLTVAWLTVLGDSVPPSVGVVAAYMTGIIVAFALHRGLVFRVRGRVFRDFLAFALVNCGGLVLNAVFLESAVALFGFPRAPAAVVVMGTVAVVTFFGHRYISFRRPVG